MAALNKTRDRNRELTDEGVSESRTTQGNGIPAEGTNTIQSPIDLSTFLKEALQVNQILYERPRHGKPFRSPMWEFVRRTKRRQELRLLSATEAAASVERVLRTWVAQSEQNAAWEICFSESEDPRAEFIHTWPSVKWAAEILEMARDDADLLPLKPTENHSSKYCRFVSLVGHLQMHVEGSIFLPCVKVGEILGCSAMNVSRYRKLAIKAGILYITRRGIRVQRKADEFRFNVDLFDWKTGHQIHSEDLNICLTSPVECYADIQESQRSIEKQDKDEQKEIQDLQRDRMQLASSPAKYTAKRGPYIPTSEELAKELQRTEKLRYPM